MPSQFPPRRHHERYPCLIPAQIKVQGNNKTLEGEILNISVGGAYLRLKGSAGAGDSVSIDLDFQGERLQLKAVVVRVGGKDPKTPAAEVFGICFKPDGKNQDKLRQMVDRIRAKSGSGMDMKTPNYWKL